MTRRAAPWPNGVPCWADLSVPDVRAAMTFYRTVVGWEFTEFGDDYGGYCIATIDQHAAVGIGPLPQPDTASAWTMYIASADADATAVAVTAAGGSVLLAPGDVGELGRMFIAADPTGAVFGVWQAGRHIGAQVVNEPGGISWEDLRSTDPDAARAFYSSVFGYETQPLPDAGPDYSTFSLPGGAPIGGMGAMMGVEGLPSHWVVYFGVDDAAKAVAVATEAGGQVMLTDFDTPYGRMAGLLDPFGAPFWVHQALRA